MKIIADYIELHVASKFTDGYKYLILKRSENNIVYPGIWQPITGEIEKNEVVKHSVVRELKEETNLSAEKIFLLEKINTFVIPQQDTIVLSPVFLAVVKKADVILSDEHSEYRWVTFEEATNLIHWNNQIESLTLIEQYLKNPLQKNNFTEIKI